MELSNTSILPADILEQITLSKEDRLYGLIIQEVEKYVRGTLEWLGCNIGPETPVDSIRRQMRLLDIRLVRVLLDGEAEDPRLEDGIYFIKSGELEVILTDPEIVEGKVRMKRKWMR